MAAISARGRFGWFALAFGTLWLARGLYVLLRPAGASPAAWGLGLAAVAAGCLGLLIAALAVRSAAPAHRPERARVALGILVLLQAVPALLGIALFFAEAAPGVGPRWLAATLAPFGTACMWLGLAMLAGWL